MNVGAVVRGWPLIVWIAPLVFVVALMMWGPLLALLATIGSLLAWQKWGR